MLSLGLLKEHYLFTLGLITYASISDNSVALR
jgi:hypothetical protein